MGSRHHGNSDFNGLDYMGLFAAWHLYKRGYWRLEDEADPGVDCSNEVSFDTLLTGAFADGATWDPTAPCSMPDLHRAFCGRPFGAWVDDVARGRVSLFAGGAQWSCVPGGLCTLGKTSAGHTDADDLILGTPGGDDLRGAGGNDCLVGFGGDDDLSGNQGFDWLEGGEGNDSLYGESTGVVLTGDGDVLFGGPGDDVLRGALGKDELCGNGGDDSLWGGWDGDECLGGGWFLGGTDSVQGCDDETAEAGACDNGAFDAW